jgi:hypothetical protein
MNVASRWMIANIALDDALILPHRANPTGLNFRERQVGKLQQCAKYSSLEFGQSRLNSPSEAVSRLETLVSARSLVYLICNC